MEKGKINHLLLTFSTLMFLTACSIDPARFYPTQNSKLETEKPEYTYHFISELKTTDNQRVREFIKNTAKYPDRKVAIFSIDGVLLNLVPYCAADEAMLEYAKVHPNWKPELLKKLLSEDKNSTEYINDRALYWTGLSVNEVEETGYKVIHKYFLFYPQTFSLLNSLSTNGFEIWLVTSAPEVLYQKFMSEYLKIPKSRIIGTKTVIENNILTENLIPPFMTTQGKADAVETFIKASPLVVIGGNFRDAEMMKMATKLTIAVNPDNKVQFEILDNNSLDVYALKNKWMILDIRDVKTERANGMISSEYKIKPNEAIDI